MSKGMIHASKSIPLVASDCADVMEEGEIFAIETFATTGHGIGKEVGTPSHYRLNKTPEYPAL